MYLNINAFTMFIDISKLPFTGLTPVYPPISHVWNYLFSHSLASRVFGISVNKSEIEKTWHKFYFLFLSINENPNSSWLKQEDICWLSFLNFSLSLSLFFLSLSVFVSRSLILSFYSKSSSSLFSPYLQPASFSFMIMAA